MSKKLRTIGAPLSKFELQRQAVTAWSRLKALEEKSPALYREMQLDEVRAWVSQVFDLDLELGFVAEAWPG